MKHRNVRQPDLKADFIFANLFFNASNWRGELLREDNKSQYDVPPAQGACFVVRTGNG